MPLRSQEHATHGAVMLDSDTTRFALWAPDAQQVEVERADAAPIPMQRRDDGWFELSLACPAGTRYRYRIDGVLSVPDPASRGQPEGVHGYSQVQGHAYTWLHPQWQGRPWHEAVIYEVHVGLLGGYAGVAEHLPRLAALGVTAIELMPIGQFPGARNWGYDGVLPFAPQCSYGSPRQLKALIDQAHGLGLMVLLDVVYNHFGPDGNYLHRYASGFFREDRHTPWGAAIDFRRRQVRDFFIENALMWLHDYRFDGLRLDAVHAIDDPDFLHELARRVRLATPAGRQVWLTLENERNQAHLLEEGYDAQWNDDGHNALHVLLTGEHEGYYVDYREAPLHKLARCLSQGFVFQGEPDRNGHPRGEASGHLAPGAFVLFLQNHDQIGNRALGERLPRLCAPAALRAATALLLLAPMVPLLFMGDDWGCEQPFLFFHRSSRGPGHGGTRRPTRRVQGFHRLCRPGQAGADPRPECRADLSRLAATVGQHQRQQRVAVSPPAAPAPSPHHPAPARHPCTRRAGGGRQGAERALAAG
ncbi:malto-oligosyltrehalose trehalohydrolase [Pseudomonas brassicae]|nr:malto-oligosyltrehalose trehalohydrolase [Pseudomonas brassicae]